MCNEDALQLERYFGAPIVYGADPHPKCEQQKISSVCTYNCDCNSAGRRAARAGRAGNLLENMS